jgi:hypothetical protein
MSLFHRGRRVGPGQKRVATPHWGWVPWGVTTSVVCYPARRGGARLAGGFGGGGGGGKAGEYQVWLAPAPLQVATSIQVPRVVLDPGTSRQRSLAWL